MSDRTATVLIVEDDEVDVEIVTRGLKKRSLSFNVHTTTDGTRALDFIRGELPDDQRSHLIVLLDLNMPGMNGLNGLITLRNEAPTIPVVIVSAEEDKQIVLQAITYGAVGFITKSSPREQMTEALTQILAGNVYLPSDIIRSSQPENRRSSRRDENQIPPELLSSLTRRQLLVLERMSKGESNKQIAYNLNIAETTVKAHVSAILRKLNVHNRIQAVLCAGNIDFGEYLKR